MLKLLAYAPDERWAYVQEGDRCLLLRPPYHQDLAVREADVERAVTVHGYATSDHVFSTRRELFDFLGVESVRVWRENNPPLDLTALRERLLDGLTVEDLDRQLDRAKGRVDQGRASEALALLDRLGTARSLTHEQRRRIGEMRDHLRARAADETLRRQHAHRAPQESRFQRAARTLGVSGAATRRCALQPAA